ncbi:MAG: RNA polymerase sigma factor [Planctomycetota bacterium]
MAGPQYDTWMGGAERRFPPTEWTQLLDHSQKEAILAELCARYWKPLYSYLRASGFGNDKAKDLVQGFLTEKVIDQELIRQADKTKGRLRTFLLTAIRNYAVNVGRSERVLLDIERTSRQVRQSRNSIRPSLGGSTAAECHRATANRMRQEGQDHPLAAL